MFSVRPATAVAAAARAWPKARVTPASEPVPVSLFKNCAAGSSPLPSVRRIHGFGFWRAAPSLCDLHLSNLPLRITDGQLQELCRPFGPVTRVRLGRRASDGLPLGWAVVTFENLADAQEAARAANGKTILSRTVRATTSSESEAVDTLATKRDLETTIYVSDLPAECSQRELRMAYSSYGKVEEVFVRTVRKDNRWNVHAVVRFGAACDSEKALQATLNGEVMGGRRERPELKAFAGPVALSGDAGQTEISDVYVSNLPRSVTEIGLGDFFLQFGEVVCVHLPKALNSMKAKGHAFVGFRNVEDARRAANQANGRQLGGSTIAAYLSNDRYSRLHGSTVFDVQVTSLPCDIMAGEVSEVFQQFGDIVKVELAEYKAGKSAGYGFVRFKTLDAAQRAVQRKGLKVRDSPVVTTFSTTPPHGEDDSSSVPDSSWRAKMLSVSVSNVPDQAMPEQVADAFRQFGDVQEVHLPKSKTGMSLGYGFVRFKTLDAAERAFAEGKLTVCGCPLVVKSTNSMDREVYVSNVSYEATPQDVSDVFRQFGDIEKVTLPKSAAGRPLGYCFIRYTTRDAAQRAAAGDVDIAIRARPVYAIFAKKSRAHSRLFSPKGSNSSPPRAII